MLQNGCHRPNRGFVSENKGDHEGAYVRSVGSTHAARRRHVCVFHPSSKTRHLAHIRGPAQACYAGSVQPPKPLAPPRRASPRPKAPPQDPLEPLDASVVLVATRFVHALGEPSGAASLCDGARSIAEIANAAGIEPSLARDLMTKLYVNGLVREVGARDRVSASTFLEHVCALGRRLQAALALERPGLDALFESGVYSARLARGYLLEMTHFVRAAASHIGAAIAHAHDDVDVRLALAEYLEEEYWHGELMETGLRAAGLTDSEIARAVPLPLTAAIINSWRHAAHTDILLYGCLIAITESGPDDASQAQALFQKTVAQGILPEAAWRPYFEHMLGDGDCDHRALGLQIARSETSLSGERCESLRRAVLLHVETAMAMERAIVDYYADAAGPRIHSVD